MDKALLVGINKYPGAPLAGCINDVLDMAHFITVHCGFNPKTIRLLTDERATTAEILARLDWLVSDLRPGDRILFHYSGHGAQMATRDKKGEVDGLDEVICPVDFDWSDARTIRDKQFHTIFDRIPAGVTAVWISDSCHSGDLEKDAGGLGGRSSKHLVPPADLGWRIEAAKLAGFHPWNPQTPVHPSIPNIVLVAGCKSDQTSADASFAGRANGALTYFLLKSLEAPDGLTTPLNVLIPRMVDALKSSSYEQTPQLEGPANLTTRMFLGR